MRRRNGAQEKVVHGEARAMLDKRVVNRMKLPLGHFVHRCLRVDVKGSRLHCSTVAFVASEGYAA